MLKSLALSVALLLSGLCVTLATAQTVNNYADNPRNARSAEGTVSPEAKAEAKRLYKEGVKYGVAGLFQQAAEVLERAVKLNPGFADAHYALGHAYFDMKQWRNAIESLKVAVQLNPDDREARDRLGLARAMLWEEDNARIAAERRQPPPQPTGQPVAMNTRRPRATEKAAEPEKAPEPKKTAEPEKITEPEKTAEPSEKANAAADQIDLTKVYRVGPSDVLDIRINDSSSPQSTLFTITSAGLLEHPMLVEPMQAGGLTVDEISSRFESDLKRRALVDNPKVSVGVRDYSSHTILVSGQVKEPGTKILRREAIPLYVVVADAQPLPEAAKVTVLRNESNQTYEIDLTEAGEMSLLVRPGDVITLVPNVMQFLYIGGEVKLPGEKTYRRGLTLTQAIIAAGGVTEKGKEARLGRDDGNGFLVISRYKLKDIESGKVPDPAVKPGDRITIRD
jgi:polysaccharide biosynthesis/export protein